jgi:uncharacterized membrane protein YgcG
LKGLRVPSYLWENIQSLGSLILVIVLLIMLFLEPLLWCIGVGEVFNTKCSAAEDLLQGYSFLAFIATFLFFAQMSNIMVTSTSVSAYYLVSVRMTSEMGLFLLALFFVILCTSTALSCLEHDMSHFTNIGDGLLNLIKMVLAMYSTTDYQAVRDQETIILLVVCVFLFITVIFFVNVLIAQFNCAYAVIYQDMVGYARLKRTQIIVDTLPSVSVERWRKFIFRLHFENKVEFNEGDIGLAGGIATVEPSNAHPTTEDVIQRFGGTTSPGAPWPATADDNDEDNDRFGQMEKIVTRTLARLTDYEGGDGKKGGSATGSKGASGGGSQGAGSGAGSQGGEE